MHNKSFHSIKFTAIISSFLCLAAFACAEAKEPKSDSSNKQVVAPQEEEKNLSALQKEARGYRAQGLELQHKGNMDEAMVYYQKAIVLDPAYAVAYNDLGIVYEIKGFSDRAAESYIRCIKINPAYLSAYSNLAMLYENKRELKKAAYFWSKRAQLGSPDDPWTEKAIQRLADISLVLSDKPMEFAREQDVIGLMKDVAIKKSVLRKDNKELAKYYFNKAKIKFKKGDEVGALKIAIDANQLDPFNEEIKELIEKLQLRVLSR